MIIMIAAAFAVAATGTAPTWHLAGTDNSAAAYVDVSSVERDVSTEERRAQGIFTFSLYAISRKRNPGPVDNFTSRVKAFCPDRGFVPLQETMRLGSKVVSKSVADSDNQVLLNARSDSLLAQAIRFVCELPRLPRDSISSNDPYSEVRQKAVE